MDEDALAALRKRSLRNAATVLSLQAFILFTAAGTVAYPQAWLQIALQACSMLPTDFYLLRRDPELLRRRLAFQERKESEPIQRLFFVLVPLLALALLLIAGLDRRYGWSEVPVALVAVGVLSFLAGTFLVFRVLVVNRHASSLIEVTAEQQVVTGGPYRFVRHPMYAAFLLMTASVPLVLGSYVASALVVPSCVLFALRLLAEEKVLVNELPGYARYMSQTRSRLIPGVW